MRLFIVSVTMSKENRNKHNLGNKVNMVTPSSFPPIHSATEILDKVFIQIGIIIIIMDSLNKRILAYDFRSKWPLLGIYIYIYI